jgi:hypothetical protein
MVHTADFVCVRVCARAHTHMCIRTKESTHQFTAEGFLSVQKLPLTLSTSMSGNVSRTNSSATSVPCRPIEKVKTSATTAKHILSLNFGL